MMNTKGNEMKTRETLKEFVEILQKNESPSFALGYLESFFAGQIELLPAKYQKQILRDIAYHVADRTKGE
jgi:hypothetical protein